MKRIIYTLLVCLMVYGSADALRVQVNTGKLYEQMPAIENTSDDLLELRGSANAADLLMLRKMSGSIETLDMSELIVEASSFPDESTTGQKIYAEGELPAYMLAGSAVKNVMFPKNVKIIGEGTFSSSGLRSVNVPPTVNKIGNYAFASCPELANASLSSEAQLGIGMFKDCRKLKAVRFEFPVTYIPVGMFDGCVIYSEKIPSSVKTVDDYAFRKTALKSLNLSNISSIGEYAFADMPELSSVTFSEAGAINLGVGAFFNDKGLESLPAFMSELPKLALAQNIGKSQVVIRSSRIGEAAYANNPNIDTITLGPEVRIINKNAFRNLKGLKLVDACRLKSNVPEVDEEAFSGLLTDTGTYEIELNVAKGSEPAWKAHPVWSLFKIGQYETGVDIMSDSSDVEIIVNRDGPTIYVSASTDIDFMGIYSMDGTCLYENTPSSEMITVNNLPSSDILVIKVKAGQTVKIVKLR
ncbi:MAG: leucine-rich repeat domain-containing protein [Muribaculaceae bacterium]|nr:leucine-rich repeat domain-containing protein [Muribaculaceae bacterium]